MFHVCVQRFDVTDTAQTFLSWEGTKQAQSIGVGAYRSLAIALNRLVSWHGGSTPIFVGRICRGLPGLQPRSSAEGHLDPNFRCAKLVFYTVALL
jgi:hypothetical protein